MDDASGDRITSEKGYESAQARTPGRPRKRPLNACATCRARKVKCDERPNGCLNCERLQLNCIQNGVATVAAEKADGSGAVAGIKRKRTFRSCVACRDSKVKCSGERPACSRCRQRASNCIYDTDTAEPAWVQTIAPSTSQTQNYQEITSSEPPTALTSVTTTTAIANCPPSLAWLMASELPPRAKLHSLLEAYFTNVHPIRIFAFVHKPSFMRMLDEGPLTNTADQALLHIMCALGARFYALDYNDSTAALPRELVQSAGSQWAKTAEEMFFADYSSISITKLKTLVLLHDHEARTGNYAGSFLLTGLIIRMAHALQINIELSTDVLCKDESSSPNEASLKESRRRLMWACYMVDVWAGSGVDQLTILNERDIKLQLPCNERQFLLQIPCITERLKRNEILDFIPPEDVPEKPWDNMGISAYYIRIVNLWQKVLRLVKHLDEVQSPWLPNSEFAKLIDEIRAWKENLPSWLDFSSDNIYIRRESSQLGALFLIHCMYHHVLCDIHRIALPELFKIREPFEFPFEQHSFMARLQTICFENAQRISVLISTTLQHGVKHLADPILPSFVYNSSRIMLYYVARILDLSKADAVTVIRRTIELVQQNNHALREMSLMYPLAEPLYITTERWLEKVLTSITRGQTTTYIGPQDPSDLTEDQTPQETTGPSPSSIESVPDQQLNPLSVFRLTRKTLRNKPHSDGASSPSNSHPTADAAAGSYQYPTASPQQPQTDLVPLQNALQPTRVGGVIYPDLTAVGGGFEQPVFDLNDLQNFWEWESSATGENAPSAAGGFDGFNPLGWMNNFNGV